MDREGAVKVFLDHAADGSLDDIAIAAQALSLGLVIADRAEPTLDMVEKRGQSRNP